MSRHKKNEGKYSAFAIKFQSLCMQCGISYPMSDENDICGLLMATIPNKVLLDLDENITNTQGNFEELKSCYECDLESIQNKTRKEMISLNGRSQSIGGR